MIGHDDTHVFYYSSVTHISTAVDSYMSGRDDTLFVIGRDSTHVVYYSFVTRVNITAVDGFVIGRDDTHVIYCSSVKRISTTVDGYMSRRDDIYTRSLL